MASYRTLEVYLETLFVNENGAVGQDAAANVLTARLIYPRPGIPLVTTAKTLHLEDSTEHDFSDRAFSSRVLFKERVQGLTEVQLELTSQLPGAQIPEFVDSLLTGVAGTGLGLITEGIGTALLAAGAEGARRTWVKEAFDETSRGSVVIGTGGTEVAPGSLVGEPRVIRNVKLQAPADVELRKTRAELERDPGSSGRFHDHYRATEERVVLRAGDETGWVNLAIRLI